MDHADANVFIIDSSGHELVDGFVAGAGEFGEELAVEEEVLRRLRDYAA